MTRRRAFTLLELMVSIVVTGVVALVVYGAAGAAIDTQERLTTERARLQARRAMRAILTDALRNVRPPHRYGDTVLVVDEGADAEGQPADRLSFVTAGGSAPLTGETDWHVTLTPTDSGLALTAVPLGTADPVAVTALVPGLEGLRVRVARWGMTRWTEGSVVLLAVPRGVELTWSSDSGHGEPPLLVHIAERNR